jgi:hypothetical protein
MAYNSNVIIHAVNFYLEVGITLNKGSVGVLGALQFASQIHYLIFFCTDFYFDIFQLCNNFKIRIALLVRAAVQFSVFVFVALLKCFQVV